jgi:type I restriction enzyme S subunit
VGRAALVSSNTEGFLYAGYLIRIRLDPKKVHPEFVQYAFNEPSIRAYIESLAKSTSGVNNINSEQLRVIELRIPTPDEQTVIIEKIRAAFSAMDAVSEQVDRATDLFDRLDQATLTKAFQGELV